MLFKIFMNFFKGINPLREEEYNIKSKYFNPFKTLFITMLYSGFLGFFYMAYKLIKLKDLITTTCPAVIS